jgi:AraC-like DNA-binding protein
LEHAAQLLHRRALLGTSQSLSEIGYACGFSDYTHFARKFRYRFGHAPGVHSAEGDGTENGIVRTGSGQSAIHAFGDLNFAIFFLPRTDSMRAIALQYVAIT